MRTYNEEKMAGAPGPIGICILEDRPEIRDGLAVLIEGTGGFRIAGKFGSVESALPRIGACQPYLILIDIGLPGMSGIDGIPPLLERCPGAVVLVLTVHDDDDRIFRALCAGACGYLLKTTPPAKLLDSLREAATGGAPMSPDVARRVVELFRRFVPPAAGGQDLTPHQQRLLRLLSDGHNYKRAAQELGVSVNTVAFHAKRIYEKLHVHSKSEAVAKAFRHGLIR